MPSNRNNKRVVYGSLTFDSMMERDYYLELEKQASTGLVASVSLQPRYCLQESFTKNGVKYRPIFYNADFHVEYTDGRVEIIDVKGHSDAQFKLKRKMFEYTHDHLTLRVVTKCPAKYNRGDWIDIDELARLRKASKKQSPL